MGGFLGLEGQSCIEPGYKYVAHPISPGNTHLNSKHRTLEYGDSASSPATSRTIVVVIVVMDYVAISPITILRFLFSILFNLVHER
jgi:hypothetical protein